MTWLGEPTTANVKPGTGSQNKHVKKAITVLKDAVSEYDNLAFLWTGGKEANVIANMLLYAVKGDNERTPVPFVTIDTGNNFDAMYEFREKYVSITGDNGANTTGPPTGINDHRVIQYDEMLESVINNPADPRGYHGSYDQAECPVCETSLIEHLEEKRYECSDCGFVHTVPDDFCHNMSATEWGVSESCGALKTVPMRRLILDNDFDALITGRRGTDPLTPGEDNSLKHIRERSTPAPHTRINPLAEWGEENIYAYIKMESVSLPSLYKEKGYRHTDSKCCTDDDSVGEYGEGGRDPEKQEARSRLEQMGYV